MRLILSRKGFDSSAGGHPSPVLPHGQVVSLPIPSDPDPGHPYRDLAYHDLGLRSDLSYADLMRRLGIEFVQGVRVDEAQAHADPDLDPRRRPGVDRDGWLPMLGQADSAQSQLRNRSVGEGDVFLFYGRFCHTEPTASGALRYVGEPFHLIWGHLQVGRPPISVASAPTFDAWMHDHVHVKFRDSARWKNNTLYVGKERSSLLAAAPGGGIFATYRPELCLTMPSRSASVWRLALAFHPSQTTYPLTYNADPRRWSIDGRYSILRSASPGQEFVVEVNEGIRHWLLGLLGMLKVPDVSRWR